MGQNELKYVDARPTSHLDARLDAPRRRATARARRATRRRAMSVLALDVARDVAAPRRAEILETLRALARRRRRDDARDRERRRRGRARARVVRRVLRARARRERGATGVRARERKAARGGARWASSSTTRRRRRRRRRRWCSRDSRRSTREGDGVVRCVKPNWARGTAFALKSRAVRVNATAADAADAWGASADGGRRRAHRRERAAHGAGRERGAGEVRRLRRRGGEEGV